MRDTLEQALADRLHDVADALPDEIDAPAGLQMLVARRRRTDRRRPRAFLAAVAVVACAIAVPVALQASRHDEPNVAAVDERDPLAGGTFLAADGRDVVVLDQSGHTLETMVHAARGEIVSAQASPDHETMWYLSVDKRAGKSCGELVQVDIRARTSKLIGHATAFAISPDGARMARAGRGPLDDGGCLEIGSATMALEDVATRKPATTAVFPPVSGESAAAERLSFSSDGRRVAASLCTEAERECEGWLVDSIDERWSNSTPQPFPRGVQPRGVFGTDALFTYGHGLARTDLETDSTTVLVPAANDLYVEQVMFADGEVFFVGRDEATIWNRAGTPALYRFHNGEATLVRAVDLGEISVIPTEDRDAG